MLEIRRHLLLAAVVLLSFCILPLRAQDLSDYQVKAAYFYHFAKFVEWPQREFTDSTAPRRFCVLHDKLFEVELARIAKGRTVGGHATEIVAVEDAEQSRKCHALFVNSSQQKRNRRLLVDLHGTSVLTVGEGEDFLQDGGMIAFVIDQERVQFEVNRQAIREASLYVSSKMLTLARRVVN